MTSSKRPNRPQLCPHPIAQEANEMQLNQFLRSARLLVLLSVPVSVLLADEPSESVPSDSRSIKSPIADSGEIQSWIEKLESPRYRDRAQASAELGKLGIHAIEALEKTAIEGGSESSDRAIEILKRHYSSQDSILQTAATEALRRISQTANASKAEVAKQLLDPSDAESKNRDPKLAPQIPVFPPLNPRNLNPGNVNRRSTSITIRNGNREVTVEENGKSIRVSETQNGVEVEKNDGSGKVTKQQYKDLQEMKEKDPDGYLTYEKAMPRAGKRQNRGQNPLQDRGKGQPQIRIPNFDDQLFPDMGPAIQGFPGFDHQDLHKRLLEQHQGMLQQHLDRMKQFRGGQPGVQPFNPAPNNSRPSDEEPAPESKKPMKIREIESIDV